MISISPTTIQPPTTVPLCLEVSFKSPYRAPVLESTITAETTVSRSDSTLQNQDQNSSFNLTQSQQPTLTRTSHTDTTVSILSSDFSLFQQTPLTTISTETSAKQSTGNRLCQSLTKLKSLSKKKITMDNEDAITSQITELSKLTYNDRMKKIEEPDQRSFKDILEVNACILNPTTIRFDCITKTMVEVCVLEKKMRKLLDNLGTILMVQPRDVLSMDCEILTKLASMFIEKPFIIKVKKLSPPDSNAPIIIIPETGPTAAFGTLYVQRVKVFNIGRADHGLQVLIALYLCMHVCYNIENDNMFLNTMSFITNVMFTEDYKPDGILSQAKTLNTDSSTQTLITTTAAILSLPLPLYDDTDNEEDITLFDTSDPSEDEQEEMEKEQSRNRRNVELVHKYAVIPFKSSLQHFLCLPEVQNDLATTWEPYDSKAILDIYHGDFIRLNPLYNNNQNIIHLELTSDDLQISNPVGNRHHKMFFFYWSMLNLQRAHRSCLPAKRLICASPRSLVGAGLLGDALKSFLKDLEDLSTNG
ncbi:unnamed protein product, partial [Didymodactylos carnosus]